MDLLSSVGTLSSKQKSPRKAQISDLELCCKHAIEFYLKGPWSQYVSMDPQGLVDSMVGFIESEDSLVLVSEDGLFIGTIAPTILNPEVFVAQEMVWYCKREGREFLRLFEEWAHSKELNIIIMSQIVDDKEPIMRRLFRKYGYRPIEATHIKVI